VVVKTVVNFLLNLISQIMAALAVLQVTEKQDEGLGIILVYCLLRCSGDG
jgi:hypothetical protein